MPSQPRQPRREFPDDTSRQDRIESLIYIDDRTLTRDCVAGQLAAWLPEFSLTAVANYGEIRKTVFDERTASILHNTHALRIEDVEFLRNLPAMQHEGHDLRVAVLSDLESAENVVKALRHGVSGYLLTTLSLRVAAVVIRLIHAGGTFVPSSALLDLEVPAASERGPMRSAPKVRGFTRRQVEVLSQLREGKQNKAIAFDLKMSESTVKIHLHHIMQKLQVTNRMEVILRTRDLFEERGPAVRPESAADVRRRAKGAVSALWPVELAPGRGEAPRTGGGAP